MSIPVQLCSFFSGQQFFDDDGNPLSGGKIYSYVGGTDTLQATYTTAAADVVNSNPLELDSAGRLLGEIWVLASTFYKFKVTDSTGTPVITMDQIYGLYSGPISGSTIDTLTVNTLTVDDYLKVPSVPTVDRDPTPEDGILQYNPTTLQFEGYYNGAWQSIAGGQLLGNAQTKAIFYNSTTIGENLTLASGTNGLTAGPITVNDTYTVTISNGSIWTVV